MDDISSANGRRHAVAEYIVVRIDSAFVTDGGNRITAKDDVDHVALGLRMGLQARLLAAGLLLDNASASSAAFDILRTMAEACAHLMWLLEGPGTLDQRALCLHLAQAEADHKNRCSTVQAMAKDWIPEETRANVERGHGEAVQAFRSVAHGTGNPVPVATATTASAVYTIGLRRRPRATTR